MIDNNDQFTHSWNFIWVLLVFALSKCYLNVMQECLNQKYTMNLAVDLFERD